MLSDIPTLEFLSLDHSLPTTSCLAVPHRCYYHQIECLMNLHESYLWLGLLHMYCALLRKQIEVYVYYVYKVFNTTRNETEPQ
jgi:hypothetical protein